MRTNNDNGIVDSRPKAHKIQMRNTSNMLLAKKRKISRTDEHKIHINDELKEEDIQYMKPVSPPDYCSHEGWLETKNS